MVYIPDVAATLAICYLNYLYMDNVSSAAGTHDYALITRAVYVT